MIYKCFLSCRFDRKLGAWDRENLSGVLRTFIEKVTDRVTEKVTDGERAILSLLAEDPAYTYTLVAQKLDISWKTVSQRIKSLKEKGVIQRIGSEKKGYWKIHSE